MINDYQTTADYIRRRRGLLPDAPVDEELPRIVKVPVYPGDEIDPNATQGDTPIAGKFDPLGQAMAANPPQKSVSVDPRDPANQAAIPGGASAASPTVDPAEIQALTELHAAQESDRKSRLTAGMELAGRQLVAGITRTEVPRGIGANPSQVPAAMEAAKTRRQTLADQIARKRQEELDASKIALEKSETDKNNRLPEAKPPRVDPGLSEYQRTMLDAKEKDRQARLLEIARKQKAAATQKPGEAPLSDAVIEAMANGQLSIPSSRSKNFGDTANRILAKDKNFDETKQKTYQHTRNAQATDSALNSAKTTRDHFAELNSAVADLPDDITDSPGINRMAQGAYGAAGSAKYTRVKTIASVLGDEMAQSLKVGDMTGKENLAKLVDPAQTKKQWAVSIPTLAAMRDAKIATYDKTLSDLGPKKPEQPKAQTPQAPGGGYIRAKNKKTGKPGWYDATTHDFVADP